MCLYIDNMITEIGLVLVLTSLGANGTDLIERDSCDDFECSVNSTEILEWVEDNIIEGMDDPLPPDCPMIDGEWRTYDLLERSYCYD